MAIGTPNSDAIDLHHPLDHVGPLHQPYHRHIPSAAELERMVSERGWRVVEFLKVDADTRVPFVNGRFCLEQKKELAQPRTSIFCFQPSDTRGPQGLCHSV